MTAARRPPEVARVLERVTKTARRYEMFAPGQTVLAAVSGGPDSICLLHALWRLRRLLRIEVACFHFDHALRTGSERDAGYVRGQAERLGVPFHLRRAESRPRRGESVETWARVARYGAMEVVREEIGAARAAVGHTNDDRAETVIIALLRGGGLESMSGMKPVRDGVIRPLIETTRAETLAFCRALGLRPRRDPMNEDPAYLRTAIRKRIIPEMERATGREVRSTLARTAALLTEDSELLEQMAAAAVAEVIGVKDGDVLIAAEQLTSLPGPLASRVARRALLDAGAQPEEQRIDRVRELAAGRSGRREVLGGGLGARRERGYVRIFKAGRARER